MKHSSRLSPESGVRSPEAGGAAFGRDFFQGSRGRLPPPGALLPYADD